MIKERKLITKSDFQSILNKYYLGKIEQVKWQVKNKNLLINFISLDKSVMGQVKCKDFPLEDVDLAIYETKKLDNLISVLSGEIWLELEKQKEIVLKLKMGNNDFDIDFTLSDPLLIKDPGSVNFPDTWEIECNLYPDNISKILKAKNALPEINNLVIASEKNEDFGLVCKFIFGDDTNYDNKIIYQLPGNITQENIEIRYDSDMLKSILTANRDLESGILKISKLGLMNLQFQNENITSNYYMVPQEGGVS